MNPESHRPYWLVGLLLLVAVVAVLIAAFVLNRQFRPQVGTRAAVTVTAAGSPPATPAVGGPAASPTAQPVASSATPAPTPVATATPTPLATPVAVVTAPGATPPSSGTVAAIEHAYLRYWDIYSRAIYTLDPSQLDQVMVGTELTGRQQQIAALKSKHQAAKIAVTHSYVIVVMGPTRAAVEDRYLNKSYLVDATTKRPLEDPGAGKAEDIIFHLELTADGWKVASSSQGRS